MSIPRQREIPYDLVVRGSPTVVYLHLLNELDPVEFREVKRASLAVRLDLSETAIQQALNLLVARRYLERAPTRPGVTRRYRLVWSMIP